MHKRNDEFQSAKEHLSSTPKFNRTIYHVAAAQSLVIQRITSVASERVPLEQAYGRYLAAPVNADVPVPHFRRSVMDGYAVRAIDTTGASASQPIQLKMIDEVPCGSVSPHVLQAGEAIRIMTGAQVPAGADAVVKYEWTSAEEQHGEVWIEISGSVKSGENVLPIGMEIAAGERLVASGERIGSGQMGLLAMFGCAQVAVHKRPQVAVLSTGHELLGVDEPLAPGKIRNSNAYLLAAQIEEAGAVPHLLHHVPDHFDTARDVVEQALASYDAVVTTGGVSVGDYDVLYDITNHWDGELLFNKLAMRPGSPTTVGLLNNKPLFALSGNPSACFVGFELFVRPALLMMQGVGAEQALPVRYRAKLAQPFAKVDTFERLVRGTMWTDEQGQLLVRPVGLDVSSVTITIRDANCLIVIPAAVHHLDAEAVVDIIPLRLRP
ncbi:molybdopterin molybdotransferase MoeA [Paenibacillus sp. 481]|uniref:molybdopterin molybdotransferase MoeA n=1 Tax=Paenibacillus sp. 481 TaxID=2835869 RepID=UPI001E3516BD|nr:gephyrin-like molybdotransferase Glp [Paenibacillus sp. 481]UHA72579.1 molybdopterin molybdotransferase MoeA [Paenibacillus sp. 481]